MAFATSANQIAVLKELYDNPSDYLKDLVYAKNPLMALISKDESPDGMGGKYLPVPTIYGLPQGRSATFANSQGNQTATNVISFFVYIVQNYQIVTITNLLMEQTKSSAAAFVDEAKLTVDKGLKNISNDLAFQLFNDGYGTRGILAASAGYSKTLAVVTMQLANIQAVVNFEPGMTLCSAATNGGAPSADTVLVTNVDRAKGIITGTASTGNSALSGTWANGAFISVQGDVPAAGISNISQALGLSGLGAWVPKVAPTAGDNFWGVDRSADPTRLGGLRYDASSYTIEEGITNALAFMNREGASPDMCIMDFASFAALVNALGAKVQYVSMKHDEVDVAFEGVSFLSAYGRVNVLADRSCPAQTAYILTMDCWKLRSLGKVPKILTYGMEGLEGLRVGNADALEIRIAYYAQLINNAPGLSCVVSLSA